MTDQPEIVQGRSCQGCTLCCKYLGITELQKPVQQWCDHCQISKGCEIYEERPGSCRDFYCGWLLMPDLGPHWEPGKSRLLIAYEPENNRFVIHADPNRSDWKKREYYQEIKGVSRQMVPQGGQVMVRLGQNVVAILPNQDDIHLGIAMDDELIVTLPSKDASGRDCYEMVAMKRDDPRLAGFDLPVLPGTDEG